MLTVEQFVEHRQRLLDQMQDNSIAVIPSAALQPRNRDVDFPLRQDSDFFYLSGFVEDNACLVLIKKQNQTSVELFCHPKIKEQEIWEGIRLGPEAAVDKLNVSAAHSNDTFDEILPKLMADCDAVYAAWGARKAWDEKLIRAIEQVKLKVRTGITAPTAMLAIEPLLHEQRLIKGDAEIAHMSEAAELSAQAHIKAMQAVKPGMQEFQLQTIIEHHCAMAGGRTMAYPSIVGSGDNACILHYTENDQTIEVGDLILIDAGCEINHYAADITRTFPSSGKFSTEQKALYQVVLDAQFAAIDAVKPGSHFNHPHEAALKTITQGLVDLGLLEGDVDKLIEDEAYKPFYMHKTGHWLGLDVHDVGQYKQDGEWRTLQAGMVLTVEPGLYVAPDEDSVDAKWRGIGIRIEDDVLVTESGNQVLTASVPKSVSDIEALMAK